MSLVGNVADQIAGERNIGTHKTACAALRLTSIYISQKDRFWWDKIDAEAQRCGVPVTTLAKRMLRNMALDCK